MRKGLGILLGAVLLLVASGGRAQYEVQDGGVWVVGEGASGWVFFGTYRCSDWTLRDYHYWYKPGPSTPLAVSYGADPVDGWYLHVLWDIAANRMDVYYTYLFMVR